MDALENKFKFKLTGTGTISFHIGCDLFHDSKEVILLSPHIYIDKMVNTYLTMFGTDTKLHNSVRPPS